MADGLKGLDIAVGDPFPNVPLKRCTVHLKRNLDNVKHGDKLALAEDLRDVFRTGERTYTRDTAWGRWQEECQESELFSSLINGSLLTIWISLAIFAY